jgi:hypothetical protein
VGKIIRSQKCQDEFTLEIPLVELLVMIRAAYKAVLPAGGSLLGISANTPCDDGELEGLVVSWAVHNDQTKEDTVAPTLPDRAGCPLCGADDAATARGRCGSCGRRRGLAELGLCSPPIMDGDGPSRREG